MPNEVTYDHAIQFLDMVDTLFPEAPPEVTAKILVGATAIRFFEYGMTKESLIEGVNNTFEDLQETGK